MISMFNDHYIVVLLGKGRLRGRMRTDTSLRRSFLTLVAATSVLVVTFGWYFLNENGVASRIRLPPFRESKVRPSSSKDPITLNYIILLLKFVYCRCCVLYQTIVIRSLIIAGPDSCGNNRRK